MNVDLKNLSEAMTTADIRDYGICAVPEKEKWLKTRNALKVPEEVKCLIMCVFPYLIGDGNNYNGRNVAKYAVVRDYHEVVIKKLEKACDFLFEKYKCDFRPFADNSPFNEVLCASSAGLGIIGNNGLLITLKYGSFVVIGEIASSYSFPLSIPSSDSCKNCGKCKIACPVDCINGNKENCVSKVTQKKFINKNEEQLIRNGKLLCGCDICQDVCPFNMKTEKSYINEFIDSGVFNIKENEIEKVLSSRAFGYKGSEIIKRNYRIINGT